ncbi:hypothetical protein CSIRO_1167 [Bradyrhizobiaceae bacterium SG-6C]|nr:hypothetical protein CSIRO_1167 [Bradyrhizobiaceae bacterium SG-6C]
MDRRNDRTGLRKTRLHKPICATKSVGRIGQSSALQAIE